MAQKQSSETTVIRIEDIDKIKAFHLENELILTDNLEISTSFPPYFRSPAPTIVLVEEGVIEGCINLNKVRLEAPCLAILLPDDILEPLSQSEVVHGKSILMSDTFAAQLELKSNYDLYDSIRKHPVIPLNAEAMQSLQLYFDLVKRTTQLVDNPNRTEMIVCLTRAMYYGAGYYFHQMGKCTEHSRNEQIVSGFMQLVHAHCRKERRLEFYASKMCLSNKYLANVISSHTHKPASHWIQEHVLLEAKSLLRSGMSTCQVADALHFPDPSVFGKYFRRYEGITPAAFRKKGYKIPPHR